MQMKAAANLAVGNFRHFWPQKRSDINLKLMKMEKKLLNIARSLLLAYLLVIKQFFLLILSVTLTILPLKQYGSKSYFIFKLVVLRAFV